jgi:exosortase
LAAGAPVAGAGRLLLSGALLAAWGLFLLAELIRQFDPHWRMVGCMMTISATLLTGCWLWRKGGASLVKQLSFPVAFAWTAVPWPTVAEQAVTLKLRTFVTDGTVAALHLMNIGASHQGNIIDVSGTTVLVDAACSGISSMQATLMVSLFLGEYFRFGAGRRIFLVVAGSCMAVLGNLARSTLLVGLAYKGGADLFRKYHDTAGYAETALIFLLVLSVAGLLAWKRKQPGGSLDSSSGETPALPRPPVESPGNFGGSEGLAAFAAFALLPVIAWTWFALSPGGPVRRQNRPLWALDTTPARSGVRVATMAISPDDARALNCDEAQTIEVQGATDADVYHFFWKTDSSTGFGHTPDNCMTGAGWQEEGEPINATLQVKDARFPCKVYRFSRGSEETAVVQSVWYGGDPMLSMDEFPDAKNYPRFSRLSMLWSEPRRRGLEALNVYLPPEKNLAVLVRMTEGILAEVLIPNR